MVASTARDYRHQDYDGFGTGSDLNPSRRVLPEHRGPMRTPDDPHVLPHPGSAQAPDLQALWHQGSAQAPDLQALWQRFGTYAPEQRPLERIPPTARSVSTIR
jgi:hypothetical protein